MAHDHALVERVLTRARSVVRAELERLFARRRRTGFGPLYELMADYPFREGKALRPAICMAACCASGGAIEQAVTTASALELFHNAFLVHDDVEDGSLFRRGKVTMMQAQGVPVAVNVGDATSVLALGLLLDNLSSLGVRKSLLLLREAERMARESAEGQAIELTWIRDGAFELTDRDYTRMAYKKTCWYTVIAPLRMGVICGSAPGRTAPTDRDMLMLLELGFRAGMAFQITDDLLNLEADEAVYGKEHNGDLWEGKRTVMLLHFMRNARPAARRRAVRILRTPRTQKRASDVEWLLGAMVRAGSLEHGRKLAARHSNRALAIDARLRCFREDSDDRRFLRETLRYVIDRVR
ncbi:MAG: polyprenyl synthetase family protein [Thermoanaerobaculia bacterium]